MPRFDGTGPMGRGSRTGGGFGFCGSRPEMIYDGGDPIYRGAGQGLPPRGGGRGRCFGGGHGGRFSGHGGFGRQGALARGFAPLAPGQEAARLRDQAAQLEQEMATVKERLERIETEADK
ncbi:MAG: DUF5320 domain-containing protein [Myxococcales bacterium]|nr:DUF5320 domain-containing protein [Myxococcales bacterium]